jgi:hypothetical protein
MEVAGEFGDGGLFQVNLGRRADAHLARPRAGVHPRPAAAREAVGVTAVLGRDEGSTVSDQLGEARGYIEEGWIQHALFHLNGGACVLGATLGRYEAQAELRETIEEMWPRGPWIRDAGGGRRVDIAAWNDHPGRTRQEVLDVFDKTILRLQERGE